jgi:hypothetical protein
LAVEVVDGKGSSILCRGQAKHCREKKSSDLEVHFESIHSKSG